MVWPRKGTPRRAYRGGAPRARGDEQADDDGRHAERGDDDRVPLDGRTAP